MTITIDAELEARLRAVAEARGEDPNRYAVAILTEALEGNEDPDAGLTEEEKAKIRAGLERGLADSAAGRVTPADTFYAEMNRKYGILEPRS